MKDVLPEPVHESYRKHRKQRTSQILLPAVLAALVFIALVTLVTMAAVSGTGDVSRWAEISAIWIFIPICLMGIVFLLITSGLVYLMGRLLGITPAYTGQAQDFMHKLEIRIRRVADKAVKPIFSINGFGATIKAIFGKR